MLTRGTVLAMAGTAAGVSLATVAARENVSRQEAEELMDDLVQEGTLKKEVRNGETTYIAASTASPSSTVQPQSAPAQLSQPAVQSAMEGATKFCRQCGFKIPIESKFCEKCGAQL